MADLFTKFLHDVREGTAQSLRRFVAFALIIFFIGAIYGITIPRMVASTGIPIEFFIVLPIILAVLSYFITQVAAAIFILLLIILVMFI